MRLVLIGCTGFVGSELVPQLIRKGHHLTLISRKNTKNLSKSFQSDQIVNLQLNPAEQQSWAKAELLKALSEADGVINLAGEPIAEKKWTPKHCQELYTSRISSTQGLVNAMRQLRKPPKVLINASAIGFYGTSLKEKFTEETQCGDDFLANLCTEWESAAKEKPRSTRLIILRIGIVLGANGGALGKMLPIFKAGLGGPIGNGKQWMSWIYLTDLCEIIKQALTNKSWSGVINAVAPEPTSMSNFALTLGKCLDRPTVLPVPEIILKLLLGDGARVVLEGQYVESKRLQRLGYQFQYSNIKNALMSIIKPKKTIE